MSRKIILETKGIAKHFGDQVALRDINFSVAAGETKALLGENGAGKSTLVKVITGVYVPDAGQVMVHGVTLPRFSPRAAMNAGIAVVHQDLSLVPQLSVAANVFLGDEMTSRKLMDQRTMNQRVQKLIDQYNLPLVATDEVGQLNYGHRQMVEILKALRRRADLFIFDEPTASLSASEAGVLFKIIADLKANGKGVIYITHRMDEVFLVSDMVTILRDGSVVTELETKAATLDALIELMMGTPTQDLGPGSTNFSTSLNAKLDPLLQMVNVGVGRLHDLTWSLYPGEILGIAGILGSGRTTIAQSLFGLRSINFGEIILDGKNYTPRNPRDAIRQGIALVPEQRREQGIFGDFSIAENIAIASWGDWSTKLGNGLSWVNDRLAKSVAQRFSEEFKMRCAGIAQEVGQLSGGTQQKVILSRWLARDPRILIMDDPTAGVDIATKREIWELMRHLSAKGTAVIFISSDLTELASVANRVLVLRDGGIVRECTGLLQESDIRRSMLSA